MFIFATLSMAWKIVIAIAALICCGVSTALFRAFRFVLNNPGYTVRDQVLSLGGSILCALAMLWCIATCIGVPTAPNELPAEEPPATTEGPQEDPNALEDGAFITPNDEDMILWAMEKMKYEGKSMEEFVEFIRLSVVYDQMPSQMDKRTKAIVAACREYLNKDHEGWQDGVGFPATEVLEKYYGGEFKKMSNEEREEFLEDFKIATLVVLPIASPTYCDMLDQGLLYHVDQFPVILERLPWLKPQQEKIDQSMKTEDGMGICYEKRKSLSDPRMITTDQALVAIRTGYVYYNYGYTVPQIIDGLTSIVNWHLPLTTEATLARTEPLVAEDEQDSLPSFGLLIKFKSGKTAIKDGINLFDLRLVVYDPNPAPVEEPPAEKPADKPEEETPPPPPPKTEVTYYTLTVQFIDEQGNELANRVTERRTAGEWYNVAAKSIDGYTPLKSAATGNMPKSNHTEYITYRKNVVYYTLTVRFVDEQGKKLADPVTEKHVAGEWYNVKAKSITGYTPVRQAASGNMPARDHTEDIVYRKGQYTLTVRYLYTDTNIQAFPDYRETHGYGDYYYVASKYLKGYDVSPSFYDGNMPASDKTVIFWYTNVMPDGQGGKRPEESNGNQHPDHPGGDLPPTDGTGDYQRDKPPVEDTAAQQRPGQTTSGVDGLGQNTSAGSDYRQEESGKNVSATDPNGGKTGGSSGLGGQDPSQVSDPNGGTTFGGNTPDKSSIAPVTDTTATQTETKPGGGSTTTTQPIVDQPVNTVTVEMPD